MYNLYVNYSFNMSTYLSTWLISAIGVTFQTKYFFVVDIIVIFVPTSELCLEVKELDQ